MNRSWQRWILAAAIVFSAALFLNHPALAGGKQTLTGEVGDAMCGRKHMEGSPADCTRACVGHGSKYALVIGDKMYILETSDKSVLALLDQQAGKSVTITGTVTSDPKGDSIAVSTAAAAK